MNICIIDDEKDNRDILTYIIKTYHKNINIIGEGDSVKSGIEIINQTKPDLVFLDIEMPDGSGFDIISQLNHHKPEIIFCTAYNHFALKAIECSALAYVLKPIIKDTIANVIEKANIKVDANHKLLQYEVLNEQLKTQTKEKGRFLLHCADKMHIIYIEELICCIAHSNYTDIHLENNKKIIVAKTLKDIESILSNHKQFIRVHQSNIININKIIDFVKLDNNLSIKLSNNMELAVSRSKREELIERLK